MPVPLAGFESFRATSLDALAHCVERLGAQVVQVAPEAETAAFANHFRLAQGELWFCSYGRPLSLRFRESDYLRVQVAVRGAGMTHLREQSVAVCDSQSCVSSSGATIEFGAGYQQIAWRANEDALVRKLAALSGRPVTQRLRFEPVLELESATGTGFMQTLRCLLDVIKHASAAQLLIPELEQSLMTALLGGARHNYREVLEAQPDRACPRQVRRAEEYISAHWNQPLRMEDIAAYSGTSVRSLFRAFRESRGYSPMEFARQRRLAEASRLLTDPEARRSVTEIAMSCGFGDFSHFSKEFSKAYGEPPSAVARRARRGP